MPAPDQVAVMMQLYRFVDQYLPVTKFVPHEPARVTVPVPTTAVLEAVARRIGPNSLSWPLIDHKTVRFRLPVSNT